MYSTEQEIDKMMGQWMTSKRFTPDAKTNAAVRERVEENLEKLGGYPSIASFERAYLELRAENAVPEFRGSISEQPSAAPAISDDAIAFINSPRTSTSELRRRYSSDPTFRQQYDAYEKSKGQTQQPGAVSLTAEQYHALPAATIVQNYRADHPRGFKAAVDALIRRGLI